MLDRMDVFSDGALAALDAAMFTLQAIAAVNGANNAGEYEGNPSATMRELDSAFDRLWSFAGQELRMCFQMIGPRCDEQFNTGDEREQPRQRRSPAAGPVDTVLPTPE
jgi:hypothetical protein